MHETEFESQNIIKAAREINDYMPHHVVDMIQKGLMSAGKKLKASSVTVLGASYKANVDDCRLSPAEPIVKELLGFQMAVTVYDPYCPSTFGAKKAGSLFDAVKGSDCLVIVTDHGEFKNLDLFALKKLMRSNPIIVDGKRILNPLKARVCGFEYYGVGYSEQKLVKKTENVLVQAPSLIVQLDSDTYISQFSSTK
jgi:UDP-N-acetyl-D-mannosaminuronic acid dehydrogenase